MKINEISVTFKFVKNLGNYQSMAAESSVVVCLEPNENVDMAYEKAWEIVKGQVRASLKAGE